MFPAPLLLYILVTTHICIQGQQRRHRIDDLYFENQAHPQGLMPNDSHVETGDNCTANTCDCYKGECKPNIYCTSPHPCPWAEWGNCSHTCGGGLKTRCRRGCSCCSRTAGCSICPPDIDWGTDYEDIPCGMSCIHGEWSNETSSCQCDKNYYGYCCEETCPLPEYCKQHECTNEDDSECIECEHIASDSVEAYHLEGGECTPKCNWLGHDCYPGTCDTNQDFLYTTCECMEGFIKVTNESSTKCDLTHKPRIETCRLGVESGYGDAANSTFANSSTNCQSTEDAFVNFDITHTYFKFSFQFTLPAKKPEPHVYIDDQNYSFGVVAAKDTVIYYNKDGDPETLMVISEDGTSDMNCSQSNFGKDNPIENNMITCQLNEDIGDKLKMSDGEKLCHKFEVTASGYVNIRDMMQTSAPSVRYYYNEVKHTEEKCFRTDYLPPDHCANTEERCEKDALNIGNRIRRDRELIVTFDGWFDPDPVSVFTQSSGIKEYEIELKDVRYAGIELVAGSNILSSYVSQGESVSITLPKDQSMYAIYLSTLDSTQADPNYRIARRFVLIDNTSKIVTDPYNPMIVTSASPETDLEWQIQLTHINVNWEDHFYNNWHAENNWLLPIRPEEKLSGVFEQETGELPVSGTPNLDGIVHFQYTYHQISPEGESFPNFTDVPVPFDQRLTLTEFQPLDGDLVHIIIKAIDIMNNTLNDVVTVKVDSSKPFIEDMYLVKDGYKEIFVHNSTDLSEMNMTFRAYDPHSGLKTVFWKLGTEHGKSDIGTQALPVHKIDVNSSCEGNCYCPDIGLCQHSLFVIPLDGLVGNDTHTGDHNREYHFTFKVMNDAHLETIDQTVILVDSSPPEIGHVFDGPPGSKDRDFQSEPIMYWHWNGFIDHESGISKYHIAIGSRCFETTEIQYLHTESHNLTEMYYFSVRYTTFAKYTVTEAGFYQISVIAFNGAMQPSKAVCSNGNVYDTTPPTLQSITVIDSIHQKSILCSENGMWHIDHLGIIQQLSSTDKCSGRCSNATTYSDERFPKRYMQNGSLSEPYTEDVSTRICTLFDLFTDEMPVFLRSDNVHLKWGVVERESQIYDYFIGFASNPKALERPDMKGFKSTHNVTDYKCVHCGLGQGELFYISHKVMNKASLTEIVAVGPIIIDASPPQYNDGIQVTITESHIILSWQFDSFIDPEYDDILQEYEWALGTRENVQEVEPWSIEIFPYNYTHDNGQFEVSYPKYLLQEHDQDQGKEYIFALKAFNRGLIHTIVLSDTFYIHSKILPTSGMVIHVNADDPEAKEIGFQEDDNQICVKWNGFNHYERELNFSIGVGTKQYKDNIVPIYDVQEKDSTCIGGVNFSQGHMYYVIVMGCNDQGCSNSSSKGVYIAKENSIVADAVLNIEPNCPIQFEYVHESFIPTSLKQEEKHYTFNIHQSSQPYMTTRIKVSKSDIYFKNYVTVKYGNEELLLFRWHFLHDEIWLFYNFIPFTLNFTITVMTQINVTVTEVAVHKCREHQHLISTNYVNLTWYINYPHVKYITHYEVSLQNFNTNLTAIQVNSGAHNSIIFENSLYPDIPYTICAKPCYQITCISQSICQRFAMDFNGPVSGEIHSSLFPDENQGVADTNIFHLSAEWDLFNEKDITGWQPLYVYDWTLAKDGQGTTPLLPWTRVYRNGSADDMIDEKVYLHVYKYATMFLILRTVGTSGIATIASSQLELKDLRPASGVLVFDLAADYNIDALKDYLHSSNLGKLNKELHNSDIDFTRDDDSVSSAILGCNCGKYIWTIQLDSSQRCVDREQNHPGCIALKETSDNVVKFTRQKFQYSTNYTICVTSGGMCSKFHACSNGFIVDTKSPLPGIVTLGKDGRPYSSDTSSVYIQWIRFTDIEMDTPIPYVHGIKKYQVALGTAPDEVDTVKFTNVSLSSHAFFTNLSLTSGRAYYATVKACDHVDLCTTAVSQGLLVDNSPPKIERVELTQNNANTEHNSNLIVRWTNAQDSETGIANVEVAIGTTSLGQDVHPYTRSDNNFLAINSDNLIDGHVYYAHIKATNRVGLWTLKSAIPLLYDSSPPEAGYVRHGLPGEVSYTYTTNDEHIKCHWAGFTDSHTGIFFYRIAVGTSPDMDDFLKWKDIGQRTEYEHSVHLKHGQPYYITVEACNGVLLCQRAVSAALVADTSKPITGMVHIGYSEEHEPYQYNRHSLSIQWFGFHDPESKINHYEWCISTLDGTCDVVSITNAHKSTHVLTTGLNLPTYTKLFVSVIASNNVDMNKVAHSKVFIIDPTSPIIVSKPILTTYSSLKPNTQYDRSYISLKWKMDDPETPMLWYSVSILSHHDGITPVPEYILGNLNDVTIPLSLEEQLKDGNMYTVKVTGCNAASLCNSTTADDFLVDSSPPVLGGFTEPMYWRIEGANTILNLSWAGFTDPHSSISKYYLMFSTQYNGADLSDGITIVEHNPRKNIQNREFVLNGKNIPVDVLIYLKIWAENGVGLLTDAAKISVFVLPQAKFNSKHKHGTLDIQKHSCDIHYCNNDCTCAIVGGYCITDGIRRKCVERNDTSANEVQVIDGIYNNPQRFVTPSSVCLQAYWTSDYDITAGITRFVWSVSMTGYDPGFGLMDIVNEKYIFDVELYDRAVYCTKENSTFLQGERYGYHIGAWHNFYEYSHFTSPGVVIDTTPPTIALGKHVKNLDANMKLEIAFTSDTSGVYASWDKVFSDAESGIKNYIVSIGTSQGGNELYGPTDMGLSVNISYTDSKLHPGVKYYTTVIAFNNLGMVEIAYSAGFIVDIENPDDGVVFTGKIFHDDRYKSGQPFSISWNGFSDQHSFIKEYQYSIAKLGTPIQSLYFVSTNLENEILIKEQLVHNQKYSAYVKAFDAAGHESNLIESSYFIIDKTPPTILQCVSTNIVFPKKMNCTCTPIITHHDLKHCKCFAETNMTSKKGDMYKITLHANDDLGDSMAKLEIGDETEWVYFQRLKWNLYQHEGYFVANSEHEIIAMLYFNQEIGTDIMISVSKCKKQEIKHCIDCNPNVVQLNDDTLKVIIPAYDSESDIQDVYVGIGTNLGGFQLSPVANKGKLMSFIYKLKLQHKMLTYVNAIITNNAGLEVSYTFDPILIDWTPPFIHDLQVTIQNDVNNVIVSAEWNVTEDESTILDCFWAVGFFPDTDDILTWQQTETTLNTRGVITNINHGDVIYVTVKCYNILRLHGKITSEKIIILIGCPDSNNANVQIYPQRQTYYNPRLETQSSVSELEFIYHGFYDSTGIAFYEYQVGKAASWKNSSKQDYVSLDNVYLQNNERSVVSVRAVNKNGFRSDAVQTNIIVNSAVPQILGNGITWQFHQNTLTLEWYDLFYWNDHYGDLIYHVYVGNAEGSSDWQKSYEIEYAEINISSEKLTSPMVCYCVITAVAPSGEYTRHYENINL